MTEKWNNLVEVSSYLKNSNLKMRTNNNKNGWNVSIEGRVSGTEKVIFYGTGHNFSTAFENAIKIFEVLDLEKKL